MYLSWDLAPMEMSVATTFDSRPASEMEGRTTAPSAVSIVSGIEALALYFKYVRG
mgnify:FL=1